MWALVFEDEVYRKLLIEDHAVTFRVERNIQRGRQSVHQLSSCPLVVPNSLVEDALLVDGGRSEEAERKGKAQWIANKVHLTYRRVRSAFVSSSRKSSRAGASTAALSRQACSPKPSREGGAEAKSLTTLRPRKRRSPAAIITA